ncbi:MAG: 8-amino-7-oxononanoate synthase [Bacteroidetes bacterium]|nr:8-amino-7-oxononanoate synthase [Bacteroidota bacterium]
MDEDFLHKKLNEREQQNAFRKLRLPDGKIDFSSNDYLGIVKNALIHEQSFPDLKHGATGSRLLSGNYELIMQTEKLIAAFHDAEAGLIFNSGYDANIGLLSSVPQREDTIVYDQLSHASIRDGIRLSFAQSFSFLHNSLTDLEEKLRAAKGNIFVVTETVFSMDGDMAPVAGIIRLCEKYKAHLIVDEAHATGVIGNKGEGLMQQLGLQKRCFARMHTFGKAVGCHGAIVLGTETLRNYLINFSRSFIYTTALPEISIAAIDASYKIFPGMNKERNHLQQLIGLFQEEGARIHYPDIEIMKSETPIQAAIVPGNDNVRKLAAQLAEANLDVRPILYPTVQKGKERLRIVLHSFNSMDEVRQLLETIFMHRQLA